MADIRVLEIFDSLQGEGVWAGVPMTFVRLAGCNAPELGLECTSWCDTPYSWDPTGGRLTTAAALEQQIRLPRACITGGEPLLQSPAVAELTAALASKGIKVHLETNGTIDWPRAARPFWITVSPKPARYRISAGIAALADEVKIVYDQRLDARSPHEASSLIRRAAAQAPRAAVCVQPEASGGKALAARAANLVLANPDWRLGIQLHKVLGIP